MEIASSETGDEVTGIVGTNGGGPRNNSGDAIGSVDSGRLEISAGDCTKHRREEPDDIVIAQSS